MIDTISLFLSAGEMPQTDILAETSARLSDRCTHESQNGNARVTGKIKHKGELFVSLSAGGISVSHSLCKYWLGNNFQTMTRQDIREAIADISDKLGVPMERAKVCRVDFGRCFVTELSPSLIISVLGELARFKPQRYPDSVCYTSGAKQIAFYDKVSEARKRREPIPAEYQGKNVLRYELRLMKRAAKSLGVDKLTAAMLYDERIFEKFLALWVGFYGKIHKVSPPIAIDAARDFKELGKIIQRAGVEAVGGRPIVLNVIFQMAQDGRGSKQQASRERHKIIAAEEIRPSADDAAAFLRALDAAILGNGIITSGTSIQNC